MKPLPDQVLSLPGVSDMHTTQFAGYASIFGDHNPKPADRADDSLFYWFVGTQDYAQRPTIIWTNGGPGSTSLWGFFTENGPYEIKGPTVLEPRKYAWNNYANYMIFEHPLDVTLSFPADEKNIPENVEMGVDQWYQSLVNFMAKHPEIQKNPLILVGESYAGTYLPLLSRCILNGNKSSAGPKLDLRATVLCDAWVDPYVQMKMDTTYAHARGIISTKQKKELDKEYDHEQNFQRSSGPDPTKPIHYLSELNWAIHGICGLYMANIARLGDPPIQPAIDYVNRPDVRKALHIDHTQPVTATWSKAVSVNYSRANGVNKSYAHVVNDLLGQDLRIIIVSGLNDAKDCNFLGTEAWLNELDAAAAKEFRDADTGQWRDQATQRVLGYVQNRSGQLSWIKVLNAGHMAAEDQPLLIEELMDVIDIS